jgi:hypothetical protein
VRTDLSPAQIAVQACHAVIEASRQFLPPRSEHPHLVLCSAASAERLLAAADHFCLKNVRFTLFREPDQAYEPTALATEPLCGERRWFMDRFRCLNVADFQFQVTQSPHSQRRRSML